MWWDFDGFGFWQVGETPGKSQILWKYGIS
jgi:hypothetical protein